MPASSGYLHPQPENFTKSAVSIHVFGLDESGEWGAPGLQSTPGLLLVVWPWLGCGLSLGFLHHKMGTTAEALGCVGSMTCAGKASSASPSL